MHMIRFLGLENFALFRTIVFIGVWVLLVGFVIGIYALTKTLKTVPDAERARPIILTEKTA